MEQSVSSYLLECVECKDCNNDSGVEGSVAYEERNWWPEGKRPNPVSLALYFMLRCRRWVAVDWSRCRSENDSRLCSNGSASTTSTFHSEIIFINESLCHVVEKLMKMQTQEKHLQKWWYWKAPLMERGRREKQFWLFIFQQNRKEQHNLPKNCNGHVCIVWKWSFVVEVWMNTCVVTARTRQEMKIMNTRSLFAWFSDGS